MFLEISKFITYKEVLKKREREKTTTKQNNKNRKGYIENAHLVTTTYMQAIKHHYINKKKLQAVTPFPLARVPLSFLSECLDDSESPLSPLCPLWSFSPRYEMKKAVNMKFENFV